MKKICLSLIAMLLLITGFAQWGSWEKIRGNGKIKKETRNLSAFTAVQSHGSWEVVLVEGNSGAVIIETDENLIPYLETIVEDGVLKIKAKKQVNLMGSGKTKLTVYLSKLTEVALYGSGDISGSGNFHHNGKTIFSCMGSGDIDISFGHIEELAVSIAGSGNIQLAGKAKLANHKISGSGDINAIGLETEQVMANISGSGDMQLWANKSLDVKIAGSGNIKYKGAATDLNSKIMGSGKIVKTN